MADTPVLEALLATAMGYADARPRRSGAASYATTLDLWSALQADPQVGPIIMKMDPGYSGPETDPILIRKLPKERAEGNVSSAVKDAIKIAEGIAENERVPLHAGMLLVAFSKLAHGMVSTMIDVRGWDRQRMQVAASELFQPVRAAQGANDLITFLLEREMSHADADGFTSAERAQSIYLLARTRDALRDRTTPTRIKL